MRYQRVLVAEVEALRFMDRLSALKEACKKAEHLNLTYFGKQCGALKRSSLDLTRALAEMRKR